jgi:hypothetical protein
MPLYLRKFYLNEVKDAIDRQNKANKGESTSEKPKLHRGPGINKPQ